MKSTEPKNRDKKNEKKGKKGRVIINQTEKGGKAIKKLVMARDQVQVSPEPTRPRINSCLFIPHNLLGLYSRVYKSPNRP
jgi:hypothetical protein